MKSHKAKAQPDSSYLSYLQPIISYFTGKSKEEPKKQTKPRRECTTFSDSVTASLSMDDKPDSKPITKNLQTLLSKAKDIKTLSEADDYLTAKKVELAKDLIIEHAARRVDLFFYLLVAIHGKQAIVSKDVTAKQHGVGSKPKGTQACHSSLFPGVKFEAIPSNWSWIGLGYTCPVLLKTRFADTLNMTTELPTVVNDFDGYLEGKYKPSKYVKSCLEILNKASKNEIDVQTGMNEFFKVMNTFFVDFDKRHLKKGASAATRQIFEYEKIGTFKAANKDMKSVDESYLHSMLFIHKPKEVALVKQNPKLLADYYKRTQNEIFSVQADNSKMKL